MSKTELAPIERIKQTLLSDAFKEALARVMPLHLTADKIAGVALVAINKSPKIAKCTLPSILQTVITAGELGLSVTGSLGEAYLVPYADQCTFQIGYRGLIKLARNATAGINVDARVVYRDDQFEIDYASSPPFSHKPKLDAERADADIVGAYMYAKWPDGEHFDYMTRAEIEKARKASKTGGSPDSPWAKWYGEMCRKTAVKRGLKYCPLSADDRVSAALETDDAEFEVGEPRVGGVDALKRHIKSVASESLDMGSDDPGEAAADEKPTERTMATERPTLPTGPGVCERCGDGFETPHKASREAGLGLYCSAKCANEANP